MGYDAILDSEIQVGDAIKQSLMQKFKDNFDFLFGSSSSGRLPVNGSFEIDSDADNVPDSWSLTSYAGGTIARDTATEAHGEASLKMVHPGGGGNGGGYADSDYIPCSDRINWSALSWSTASGMKCQAYIRWFTDAKVYISQTNAWTSVANPSTATPIGGWESAPATARFARLRLIGGYTDTDVAGSAYFDDVKTDVEMAGNAGTAVTMRSISEPETTTSASYVTQPLTTIMSLGVGVVTVGFDLGNSAGVAYGRIYVNGVAVGVEKNFGPSGSFSSFTDNITVRRGDIIELRIKATGGGTSISQDKFYKSSHALPLIYTEVV